MSERRRAEIHSQPRQQDFDRNLDLACPALHAVAPSFSEPESTDWYLVGLSGVVLTRIVDHVWFVRICISGMCVSVMLIVG